ncbi:hypothetical protein BU23DRAFT_598629 [Bimuria novae-zelandiae CBS 107.79]|uniref:Rhodopsin domain-containing protein n=1 Tax=Bimuria novae-zelandiae CBS 107.79 TaxID=1447943 RepID=A0A6A5VDN2_9PLEO|nr:hypothetical protein BU23DRAFT_598629 [Bimuria novae-zelandiae CBS 107.79]
MVTPTPEQLRELFLSRPAMVAPHGEVANFINPPSIQSKALGVVISVFLLTTLAVGIRLYTKLVVVKRLALDDYVLIVGYLIYGAGYQAVNYIMVDMNGVGEHQWNIIVRDLIPFLYYMQMGNTIYGIVILAIKVAILIQCLHVLVPDGVHTAAFWVFHFLLWSHVLFYVICTFVEIFMCNPRAKIWDPTITTGHCMNSKAVNIAAAAVNAGSDFILVIIPQLIIWRLNMSTSKKWAVGSVFLVGLLACAAATVRMYFSIGLLHNKDFTWAATLMGLWVEVEIGCGFLVACMPVFPRFFRHQPIFSTLGSGLRSLLRRDRGSAKYSSERLGSSDGSRQKKNPIVTDVEFEELVRRSDLGMVTVDHPGPGPRS